jgi:hypothetical protein
MDEASEPSTSLDRSFRSTCKVLFGCEIGGLEESRRLFDYASPMKKRKSALGGSEVSYIAPYPQAAKLIAMEEKVRLPAPKFSPNDIKDIDSLIRAARECAYYCGSKAIGNSKFVSGSDNISDSHFILSSHNTVKSEYIAYSEMVIDSKHIFCSSAVGESEFCLGISECSLIRRGFESAQSQTSSDLYYCFYARGCHDCMFSFAQMSKRNMIGNNNLEKGKYLELKKTLLSQIADSFRAKKPLSISDIVKD